MKEITADFLRQEVARLGELVVATAVYHESGLKLFSAGDRSPRNQRSGARAASVSD